MSFCLWIEVGRTERSEFRQFIVVGTRVVRSGQQALTTAYRKQQSAETNTGFWLQNFCLPWLMKWYTLCVSSKGALNMEKALIKHGNSLAIVIDKPVLDLLQITADTKIELTTNGDAIMLTPIRDKKRQARLQAALQKINDQFGDDLKKLAE